MNNTVDMNTGNLEQLGNLELLNLAIMTAKFYNETWETKNELPMDVMEGMGQLAERIRNIAYVRNEEYSDKISEDTRETCMNVVRVAGDYADERIYAHRKEAHEIILDAVRVYTRIAKRFPNRFHWNRQSRQLEIVTIMPQ